MTDIDDAYLAERERIAAAATPGPWVEIGCAVITCGAQIAWAADANAGANVSFITDARAAVPALIAEVRRLREENEELRGLLAEVAGSGVELQDARLRYLTVQIGCDLWAQIGEACK